MKKLATLFTLSLILFSCSGDVGPRGPQGFDGVNIVAQSFEFTTDLVGPDYETLVNYPQNIEVFDTDMVLVYILWDTADGDTWRLLPQTVYTDFGEFQYNYDFTVNNTLIFLTAPASFNFNTLLDGDTRDQTFRVVILPVDLANNSKLDVTDFESVKEVGKLQAPLQLGDEYIISQ